MKHFITLFFFLLIIQKGFTQNGKTEIDKEKETIFTETSFKFSGSYIAPEFKYSNLNDDVCLFIGGRMGISFNDKFLLGLAFYGLIHSDDLMAERPSEYSGFNPTQELASLKFIYGGLALEYSFFNNKLVHFNIPVILGPGKVSIKGEDDIFFERIEKSTIFVLEPGLAVEVNLSKWLRIELGASYRYVTGVSLNTLGDKDLSNLSYNLILKFDFFK
jgi:hypothetical protein